MTILYKPFAIIAGIIGTRLGQKAFRALWAKIEDAEPPAATTPQASLPRVVGARALEAATTAAIAAAVDRASAKSFHYLTGIWPGAKEEAQPD
jgi:hypothetical protein